MRGLDFSAVMWRNDNGGYEFLDEAWGALVTAGIAEDGSDVAPEYIAWPLSDNGDNPDGPSWIVTKNDEPNLDAAIAALTPLGAKEVEVAVVDAGLAYGTLCDTIEEWNAGIKRTGIGEPVRWMGISMNGVLYIVVED